MSAPRVAGRRLWVSQLSAIRLRRSVILGYHGIAKTRWRQDRYRLQVPPTTFRTQIELLLEAGFRFVTVAELARQLDHGSPPAGLAAVSFDDGLRNNLSAALPILHPLGVPATVYVATDLIGVHNPWIAPEGGGEMLTEDEICVLAGAGWEIGAHTRTHADLSRLDYEACRAEISGSRQALEQITGAPVQTFAYPFGRYGPAALAAVRDAGLLAAVTTGSGRWDRFELTRAMVSAGDPLALLLLKLADRYEPLLRTAPLRGLRTASKRLRKSG
jgi:peptidoglycan/xylan/chitin deacetylase (PgdA/CDA1 family)